MPPKDFYLNLGFIINSSLGSSADVLPETLYRDNSKVDKPGPFCAMGS